MKYKIIEDLSELNILKSNIEVFADIESGGLYIDCRLIQLYQPEVSDIIYVIDTDIVDLEEAKKYLEPLWLIFHNASYDFGTLNMTSAKFDDTQYLSRIAYPEWQKFNLDVVISRLGHDGLYDGLDKKQMQKAGFKKGSILSDEQITYAITDVYALSKIWLDSKIQKAREVMAYKVDIISLRYSITYQQNNLLVNQEAVRKELDDVAPKIAKNYELLNGLNPNSPKQVKEALGTESSSKDVLVKLVTESNNKIAKLVYDQRRLLKRQTFLNSYNYPYVTTRFNPAGAATGRFTSTGKDLPQGINAQQITRDLQYIFNTDSEDTVVIHADYSTAELRAGCSIMRDSQMYKELKAGKDLHKIAATLALGGNPDSVTKEERQKGKAISFGFIFGMSAPSFVEYAFVNYGVIFTQEEASKIKYNYSIRYPQIAKYATDRWADYQNIPVVTPLGHRNKARLGTDAINYATQGCIAETIKLAIHYLVKENNKALDYIYNIVHDAIYLRVPKSQENIWADLLTKNMSKAWKEMCKCNMLYYKDIPMPVEVEYNDYSSGKPNYICKEII